MPVLIEEAARRFFAGQKMGVSEASALNKEAFSRN
jgi:hypothetical protein